MNMTRSPAFRYVFPFFLFMFLTECQRFGSETTVFWIYGLKTILTLAALGFCFRGRFSEIQGTWDYRAALLGLLVLLLWLLLGSWVPGARGITFDPGAVPAGIPRTTAILFRILGAALAVPIMEELFWRSFWMRWWIDRDFQSIPVGRYTAFSFWITVGAFSLAHRPWEWPGTLATGILYGAYLIKTGNLRGCILAHAVTNAGLAAYVLATGAWYYW